MTSLRIDEAYMCDICDLSDVKLAMAVAKEVLGWEDVFVDHEGNIRGDSPRMLSEFPLTLEFPLSSESVTLLEKRPSFSDKRNGYFDRLRQLIGDNISIATPRLRCESMLMAYRSSSVCAA